MNYGLPRTVEIDGEEHDIRYDFRVILEIIQMLQDADLTNSEKVEAVLYMFYITPEKITNIKAAVQACFDFIDKDKKPQKKKARLMDWEQDFDYIIAPINRVMGKEIREVEYDPINNTGGVHWWTFLSAYMEIGGECTMAQIVTIRDKLNRGKKLEKHEREWLKHNHDVVTLNDKITDNDREAINYWTGGG